MAISILRKIAYRIQKAKFSTLMCDECTDVNNKEQLVLCLRWVEYDSLEVH